MYNSTFTSICWKTQPKAFLSIHNYMNNIFSFSEIGSKIIIKHNSTGNSDCNTVFGHPHLAQIKRTPRLHQILSVLFLFLTQKNLYKLWTVVQPVWNERSCLSLGNCASIMYSYTLKIYIKTSKHKQNTIYMYLHMYYSFQSSQSKSSKITSIISWFYFVPGYILN